MGRKDRRPWRKLVKKLRRKRIRTQLAVERDAENPLEVDIDISDSEEEAELMLRKEEEEMKWIEREREAQVKFEKKRADAERRKEAKEAEKTRIRLEWEELQAKQEAHRKEVERLETEKREKQVSGLTRALQFILNCLIPFQEKEFDEFLSFLAGDIETPPLPYVMPQDDNIDGKPVCPFFVRTAACRFGVQCTRLHPKPALSQILLIPNFFSHFSLEQTLRDEYDTDLSLEYDDMELYREFLVFYNDVLPEFKVIGDVIQFKVCCNYESHLRGNVYVQYQDIRQAVEAYRKFNGRFYSGRQLSLEFVKIDSWRAAICGLFSRKRCQKVRTCAYLHVFRNPAKEFASADNDWNPVTITKPAAPSVKDSSKRPRDSTSNVGSDSRIPNTIESQCRTVHTSNPSRSRSPSTNRRRQSGNSRRSLRTTRSPSPKRGRTRVRSRSRSRSRFSRRESRVHLRSRSRSRSYSKSRQERKKHKKKKSSHKSKKSK